MRIIAGTARGRRFDAPKGMDTRPTLDQVKEAMFGMLQFDVPGSRVLDLFSGSGSLGLEAASRGAESVILNDHNRACAAMIRKNAALLGFSDIVRVYGMDYAACLNSLHAEGLTFDIVLLDAPYADQTAQRAAETVLRYGMLRPGGRIVIEQAPELSPVADAGLATVVLTRRYGKCAVTIWKGTETA